MAIQTFQWKVQKEEAGLRLDHFLAQKLAEKELSKSTVRKLIVAGAVYLNQKRCRIASKNLLPFAHVKVLYDSSKLKATGPTIIWSDSWVLYEDASLLAINKPSGIPTQPTVDEARDNAFALTKAYVQKKDPSAYLGLHHRLDKDTSGVLVFVKDPSCNAALGSQFQDHTITKTYWAWVHFRPENPPAPRWNVRNFLGEGKRLGKMKTYASVRSGGKMAETAFRTLEVQKDFALIEAQPLTGRTHQIRVHLSENDLPIVGDPLYGISNARGRLLLHAKTLELKHPLTGEKLKIEAPLPKEFEFKNLQK